MNITQLLEALPGYIKLTTEVSVNGPFKSLVY